MTETASTWLTDAPPASPGNVVRPDDFDEFWAETLLATDAIPLRVECVRSELRSTADVDVHEVRYDSWAGVRVFAWYCVPRGATGPLPGLVLPPGYISDPIIPKDWARRGYAAIAPAPRGKVRSRDQFDAGYPGLLTHDVVDRQTYGYRGFYVDAVRAIDVLRSQGDVDADRIGVCGGSQGGALAIVLAALRPESIRVAVAAVPYLADMLAAIELERTYPFHEIADYLRTYPEHAEAVRTTLAYYDVLSFAPRVRCPILVNVGLRDNIVPPGTCVAAYERLGSPDKRLVAYADCGHDGGAYLGHDATTAEFLRAHLQA